MITIAKIPHQIRLIITSNLLGFSSLIQINLRPKVVHLSLGDDADRTPQPSDDKIPQN